MAVVLTETAILTDIANAIRRQNGGSDLYRPSQMAAAVTALDGTSEGSPRVEPYKELARGLLSSAVYDDIADAIRGHNGSSTQYAPGEMAAAILALTWDTGLKARAILTDDGTLEFNYRSARRSDEGTVAQCWEVDPAGYSSDTARPWHAVRSQVKRVVFDSDWPGAGCTNYTYWCCGMTNLVEVAGFEACSGATNVTQMFMSCGSLETIWATSFDWSSVTASSSVLYGCPRLVGGSGYVAASSAGASVLSLGSAGVLTDPNADSRTWALAHQYGDGDLVVTTDDEPETNRVVVSTGRICTNAHYVAVGCAPWYQTRAGMRLCRFDSSLATATVASMDYWFYSCTDLQLATGWENVRGLASMRMTFNGCTSLGALYLIGFDPSALRDLFYTFALCTSLEVIYVDSTWALPAGCIGMATFYNCLELVGGNGMAYSSSATGAAMMKVDREGQTGYLTATD